MRGDMFRLCLQPSSGKLLVQIRYKFCAYDMGRGLLIDVIVYGRVIGTDCRPRANLNELEVRVCRRSTHHAPKHTHHSFIHSLIL
jgi:hypothetical protein